MFHLDTLPNNLRVVSSYMPGFKSVFINILIKVGSRYETYQESGICHFLEHMAFKGTKTRTYLQIAQAFDVIGGQFNACTGKESTTYYAKVLAEHMELALEILADILQNSIFDPAEIDKERKVILQEIAQVQDDPDELVSDNLLETAFYNQPLGRSILGDAKTLSTFDTQGFQKYIKNHYVGDKIIISVAGNVDHAKLMTITHRLFANIPSAVSANYLPAIYNPGHKMVVKDLEQVNVILGFKGISYLDCINYNKAKILSLILGDGISSRLFQTIREKYSLVYSVGSYNHSYSDVGLFCIYGSTTVENLNKFIEQCYIQVHDICNTLSNIELEQAKEKSKVRILMSNESPGARSSKLAEDFSDFGRYITDDEYLEQIQAIRMNDIITQAQKIFSSEPTLSLAGPKSDLNYQYIVEKFQKIKQ